MQPRDGREGVEVTGHTKKSEYPNLALKVYIEGNCFLSGAIAMFARAGCTRAASVEEAELVCFLGGEDVDPSLYGERCLVHTHFNKNRDERETRVFEKCVELGTPMFGICRGMQFLHVMNGGKLFQHVSNHAGRPHKIKDVQTGEVLIASSLHHQMCIEDATTFPIAYAVTPGGHYETYARIINTDKHEDLEGAVYPNINAIAVQGHPELGDIPAYTEWALNKVQEFLDEKLPGKMGDNSAKVFGKPKAVGVAVKDLEFLKNSVK
jgi:GMP synthase-like glutamine amidotransferase